MATIFAWSGALRKRGELDGNAELADFAGRLEKAVLDAINAGTMTGDLALLCQDPDVKKVTTSAFIAAVRARLER